MKCKNILLLLFFILLSSYIPAQSVGLVLSGGGAKGLSHIGVIKALEENGIPIDYVSGTSIGAIVGGMYAIGLSPEEMIALIKSEEFGYWYKGEFERDYASYIYRGRSTPAMLSLNVAQSYKKDGTRNGLKLSLPTSIISPYPMDIAFMQLFSTSSAAANYDFNNLMIPFFCVSADILKKQAFVTDKGDLGSAIRASMTYPGYFKPISIDSTILFDGGFYNNFPWKLTKTKYNPDYIIGVKCVLGEASSPKLDDPISLLETMVTIDTDYSFLAPEEGIIIAGKYDYGLMEFDAVDQLVELGYQNALKEIPKIKTMLAREVPLEDVTQKRVEFRKKCSELRFNDIEIKGNMSDVEGEYIKNTITGLRDTFSFDQAKRGCYRVIASNTINSFHPIARMNKDSLYTLSIQADKKNLYTFSIGGNISSSSLNQGYIALSQTRSAQYPWRTTLDFDIGQYYTGAGFYWRQDINPEPLFYYNIDLAIHRFDYFTSSQSIFISNSLSSKIQENEIYFTFNAGVPLSTKRNILFEMGATVAGLWYNYFNTNEFSKYDTPDKTQITLITPRILFKENTLDFPIYPTNGRKWDFDVRYMYSIENYRPGSLSPNSKEELKSESNIFMASFNFENYPKISKWFTLGFRLDLAFTKGMNYTGYIPSVLMLPTFKPTAHSSTLFLDNYSAPIYAAASISPIFEVFSNIFIHSTFSYFQPYKRLINQGEGKFVYSDPFPMGSFLGNLALVWQSPVGPISISCAYYNKSETKWYPQFNIGYLLFRNRAKQN